MIYIAGPWFTEEQRKAMDELEIQCKRLPQCIYPRYDCKVYMDTGDTDAAFNFNCKAIKNCDALIVLLTKDKDVGTAFEIGYAKAFNKAIYFVAADEQVFKSKTNLMLLKAGIPVKMQRIGDFILRNLQERTFMPNDDELLQFDCEVE